MTDTMKEPTVIPGIVPAAATSIEALIARAIDKGVPVETMERLLVMRTQLKQEAAREAFIAALADFQATCPAVPRTSVAKIDSPRGSYSYHYAKLEDIVKAVGPSLAQHGLTYQFDVRLDTDPPRQVVICTIRHTDGHSESSTFTIPVDASARMNVAQQHASAQTYAKRYALSNALGIVTADEDDDAHASGATPERPSAPLRTVSSASPPRTAQPPPTNDPILNFGFSKGKRVSELTDTNLAWYTAAVQKSVDDPAKAKYRASNQALFDALVAEHGRRIANEMPIGEPPPPSDEDMPEWVRS